ncbi:MAG: zeta toxin family protein [Chloroflexota bacterium]
MQSSAPTLVIISGAPGSGKTTLARRLASIPKLVVDTTDGWRPSYEEVRDFAAVPRATLLR